MILYINFAPITFVGGAEIWLENVSKETSKYEQTYIIYISPKLADLYGRLVLKRKFSDNLRQIDYKNVKPIKLNIIHFIPFTKNFIYTKSLFLNARKIYIKFEIIEILISLYFGGFRVLKKTVGGIHSPFYYNKPNSIWNKIHNYIYLSHIMSILLKSVNQVHVLNRKDMKLLKDRFKLTNIIQIYDGVNMKKKLQFESNKILDKDLKILIVGELSWRKATDRICEIIINSPLNFKFTIIGDGPMKKNILRIEDQPNIYYKGYISNKELLSMYYKSNDVLLFPSRAETLGLVMIEAMSYGLMVVNSKEVSLNLPKYIERTVNNDQYAEYIYALNSIYKAKLEKSINKVKIHSYAYDKFSNNIILPQFLKKILDIKLINTI